MVELKIQYSFRSEKGKNRNLPGKVRLRVARVSRNLTSLSVSLLSTPAS